MNLFLFFEFAAQSWFETEKQTTEVENAVTEDLPEEADQPSVPTGSATELRCHVCHDEFKQFYNEEMEEWHIKPAVVFEGNNFHPFCLEDHKVSYSLKIYYLAYIYYLRLNLLYSINSLLHSCEIGKAPCGMCF